MKIKQRWWSRLQPNQQHHPVYPTLHAAPQKICFIYDVCASCIIIIRSKQVDLRCASSSCIIVPCNNKNVLATYFICLTMVLLPDSPAPEKKHDTDVGLNHQKVFACHIWNANGINIDNFQVSCKYREAGVWYPWQLAIHLLWDSFLFVCFLRVLTAPRRSSHNPCCTTFWCRTVTYNTVDDY